jgi:7-cyano-7-deazaguanine synthase
MKVVVELSGGADSALAAVYAVRKYIGATFYGFFVDYGQEYANQERETSEKIATQLLFKYGGWNWTEVSVSKFWKNSSSAVVEYVPLRNLVLTSLAISYAQSIGAEVVVTGSKTLVVDSNDPYSFRDSSLEFYQRLEKLAMSATEVQSGVRLVFVEPLLAMNRESKMTKEQVYKELAEVGITNTWSCYHPKGMQECGECRNCKEKAKIFEGILK